MADVACFTLPNIVWSVGEIMWYCTKKSPLFDFADEKWRLKLTHSNHIKGNKILIFLERITFCNSISNINMRTSTSIIDENGHNHLPTNIVTFQAVNFNKVWCVLEGLKHEVVSSYFSRYANPVKPFPDGYTVICSFLPGTGWPGFRNLFRSNETDTNSMVSSESPDILNEDIGRLFNSHVLSDVILICGDKKIYAHKAILSARSEVFAAIFRHTIKDIHEISDVEPSILEQLIRFIYTGEVPQLSLDSVYKTYAAADMYGLETLKMKCGLFMVNNSKEDEPCNMVYDDTNCEKIVKERTVCHFANIRAVIMTEEWKHLSTYDPKLANDTLQFLVKRSPA